MSERSRQGKTETITVAVTEDGTAPPGTAPKPTPEGEEERQPTSRLDMLFREAEIIAHNLKESGTRR